MTRPAHTTGDLTTGPVPGHIRAIAVPASVGFFFHTMFNVVDTYFAGHISTDALAALSLSFPVFFIIIAVGSGVGTGATALMANALGRGDRDRARSLAHQTMTCGLAMGAALAVGGILAAPALFGLLGAEGRYLDLCLSYMDIILAGAGLFMLVYCANAVLNAVGDTRPFRNFLMAGSVANLILDPWFVFGGLGLPAMGLAGVAWATLLIEACGAAYLCLRAGRTGLICLRCPGLYIPRYRTVAEISHQSFPAAANMLTVGLGIFVITYFLSALGKAPVAAFGAAVRIEQIVLLPTIGLNTAVLTIIAQNNGAGRFDRVHEALSRCLTYGAWMMIPAGALIWLPAPWLMGLFTNDPVVLGHGVSYLRIMAFLLYAYVILFLHVAALQGVRQPMFAIWIGIYRQLAAPMLVFPLLGQVMGWGPDGIWWGLFAINWSAALIALAYARRRLPRPGPQGANNATGRDGP